MAYTGFTNLGLNRYPNAVKVLKQYTTGVFTKQQGYDLSNVDSWTPAMKKKVRRYWREYDHLTARPNDIVRTRDKTKLKAIQKAALHQHYLGKFNAAFIPTDGVHKAHITYNKKTKDVLIKVGKIEKRLIPLNKMLLATDPQAAAYDAIQRSPGAKSYRIQCGQYEFTQVAYASPSALAERIERFQMKYSNYDEWLNGIVAYYFPTERIPHTMGDYMNIVEREREKLKLQRRRMREKIRRENKKLREKK